MNKYSLDKSIVKILKLHDEHSDAEHWVNKSFEERLSALEYLRQSWSNYDSNSSRLPRVYTVIKRV